MQIPGDELTALLEAEIATLSNLAEALAAEHAALLQSDPETLEVTTRTKSACVEAHSQQQQRRLQWMTGLGLAADASLARLVEGAQPRDARHASLRTRLVDLARECQEANRRNGGLIARLQERTRGALDVLRQGDNGDIYSLSGAREHRSDSRTLGKA